MAAITSKIEAMRSFTVGVDLGGTSIRVGLFDPAMNVLDSRQMETRASEGPVSAVNRIAGTVDELIEKHSDVVVKESILGLGIGSPGPIDLQAGVLGELPNLPGWDAFPLRSALAAATSLSVIIESDANAAAIAEWKLGAGRQADVSSMAMITLGTGVGSGFILNGQIWHGILGMGGEVGHSCIEPQGLLCGCGTRGCLEMYASAAGLLRLVKKASESTKVSAALHELLEQPGGGAASQVGSLAASGDPVAKLAFEQFGFYLGLGVANIINTLDLPMILIGGGVADAWELFAQSMFETVRAHSQIYRIAGPKQTKVLEPSRTFIGPAQLGSAAGLLGGGLLPHLASSDMDGRPNPTLP